MLKLADHGDQPVGSLATGTAVARRVGVLVLGMHRSGTSAITRMLNLLGCDLPKTLIAANPTNPEGHWESEPIAQLNDEIFALAGTHWTDWLPVNPRLSETLVWPQLVTRGRELLRQEFADAPLFVLKDPRICKLTGFWLEVFAAEGIDAVVVLPLRNPIEVARSLMARDGSEEYQGLLVWLRHVLAAEAATRGHPRVFTEFAALLNNWEMLSARLSDGLGVIWPRVSQFSGFEISQFLTPDLRHYVSETAELNNNPAISPWVQQSFEVLFNWARYGEKAADYQILDRISREFHDAGATFGRPLLAAGLAARSAAQAEAEHTAERGALAQRLGEVEGQFAQACADRDGRTNERDQLAGELAALGREHEAVAGQLAEVERQFAQASADRDGRTTERDQLAGELAALGREHEAIAGQLAEVEGQFAQACADRDALTAERDGLVSNNAALEEERSKSAWRLGEVEAELARICSEHDLQAAELNRLESERSNLTEEISKFTWRMGEVEADLARAEANHDQAQVRVSELEGDLATANAGAESLNHRLAVAESTLRQREEEIAQLGNALEAARRNMAQLDDAASAARDEAQRLSQECRALRDAIEANSAAQSAETNRMQGELAQAQAALQIAEDRSRHAEAQKQAQDRNVEDRFAELAELTKLLYVRDSEAKGAQAELTNVKVQLDDRSGEVATLVQREREQEQQNDRQQAQIEWLRRVHAVIAAAPRWWAIMPEKWRRERESRRLQRKGLFDADAYLLRYPDVEQEGMAPLRHYILHGMDEDRSI